MSVPSLEDVCIAVVMECNLCIPVMMAGYRDAFLEWIEFFQHAHDKRHEALLEELRTEEVKKAYERIRVKTLVGDEMAHDDHHQKILGKVKVV